MKISTLLLFLFFSSLSLKGQIPEKYETVDEHARSVEPGNASIEQFTNKVLVAGLTDDLSKVRAIYVWITENIAYDCRKFHQQNGSFRVRYTSEEDLQKQLAAIDQKNLERTLKHRRGVCQDYAFLFNTMCEAAGIESITIKGYVPSGARMIGQRPETSNHTWNAFSIDGQWHLLDATWGSGFVNAEVTSFKKQFRDEFFLMAPSDMIKTHFPEEEKWQLLDQPLSEKEYANQPCFYPSYWDITAKSVLPTQGIIDSKTVDIELELSDGTLDERKLIVIQGGKMIQSGFSKSGVKYRTSIQLKGRKNIIVMVQKSRSSFQPVIEYRVQ